MKIIFDKKTCHSPPKKNEMEFLSQRTCRSALMILFAAFSVSICIMLPPFSENSEMFPIKGYSIWFVHYETCFIVKGFFLLLHLFYSIFINRIKNDITIFL